MVELTDNATQEFKNYFKGKEISSIRIYGRPGWGGFQLMLALDESDNNDDVFEVEGFKFAVEKTLLEEMGTINIDGGSNGFLVTAANLKKSECSSAGGGCSCW